MIFFPRFLRGVPKDVYRESKKFVTKLKRNIESFNIAGEGLFEFEPGSERIVLGKAPWHGSNIYLFQLFEDIYKTNAVEFINTCYYKALNYPWAILCLMGGFVSQTQLLFTDKEKLYPFMQAANKHWQEFCSMGNVFIDMVPEKKDIWNVTSNLKKVLARLGVPQGRLLEKEMPNDLIELVNDRATSE
jgi:hypothetical protein